LATIIGSKTMLVGPSRYVVALLAVAAAWAARIVFGAWLGLAVPYLQFFGAIMVAGWAGGFGPGLAATLLSTLIATYFFLEPAHSFAIAHRADQASLPFFILIGLGISWLNESRRRGEAAQARAATLAAARADELDRANRLKDEFLATVSHELRTPLTSILGWCRLLRRGPCGCAEVAAIERSARIQQRLIDDLIDMAGITQGKLHCHMTLMDLGAVVDAAIEQIRPTAIEKGLRLERLGDSDAKMVGDPDRLAQVVWNLISNAVKFTPRGGAVTIRLRSSDETVELVVTDTGEGIDPAVVPHIFEPFRQGDSSVTRRHSGIGLGLAIVDHLVRRHRGNVQVESAGLGAGTTFRVTVPRGTEEMPT
jgi:signal transduction histidine kinase